MVDFSGAIMFGLVLVAACARLGLFYFDCVSFSCNNIRLAVIRLKAISGRYGFFIRLSCSFVGTSCVV